MQPDSPSAANTRNIKGYYKILNINNLYLKGVLSSCEKHHFDMRNGLYWRLKWTISHPNIGFIRLQNGQYQNAIFIVLDYVMGYI